MWSARLISKELKDGVQIYNIEYFNGTDVIPQTFRTERGAFDIKRVIAGHIKRLNDQEVAFSESPIAGDVDVSDYLNPTPTAEQLYNRAKGRLAVLKEELDLGIIEQAEYDVALDKVKQLKAAI